MKVVITGAKGQLGHALLASAPVDAIVVAHDIDTLDITDKGAVEALFAREKPELVLNAAAYTAVDKAESDEATARAVNATATGILSKAARNIGARFAHVSTDFVFNGDSGIPYSPDATPDPICVYGATKLEGERLAGRDALIVRTSWVYAPTGGNFVRTMLRLMGERPEVRVVADQIGTPTYAPGLARALWNMTWQGLSGLYHYSDAGAASWYDFAVAIQEEGIAAGLLDKAVPVIPIPTADYPTPARRPFYSVLDKSTTFAALGGPTPHWRTNLRALIAAIKSEIV